MKFMFFLVRFMYEIHIFYVIHGWNLRFSCGFLSMFIFHTIFCWNACNSFPKCTFSYAISFEGFLAKFAFIVNNLFTKIKVVFHKIICNVHKIFLRVACARASILYNSAEHFLENKEKKILEVFKKNLNFAHFVNS